MKYILLMAVALTTACSSKSNDSTPSPQNPVPGGTGKTYSCTYSHEGYRYETLSTGENLAFPASFFSCNSSSGDACEVSFDYITNNAVTSCEQQVLNLF